MVAAKYVDSPSAVLDYQINWAPWLASPPANPGDTIATSTWAQPPGQTGLLLTSPSFTTTTATVTVALNAAGGGVAGVEYNAINTITTVGGRTQARTVTFEFVPE